MAPPSMFPYKISMRYLHDELNAKIPLLETTLTDICTPTHTDRGTLTRKDDCFILSAPPVFDNFPLNARHFTAFRVETVEECRNIFCQGEAIGAAAFPRGKDFKRGSVPY